MLDLDFEYPCKVIQGTGAINDLLVSGLSGTGIIVTTAGVLHRAQIDNVLNGLKLHKTKYEIVLTEENPSLAWLSGKLNDFAGIKPSWCVAVGGGSSLDSGKVLSVMLSSANREKSLESVLYGNDTQEHERITLWCAPTTSGTGAEVTPFATVWDKVREKKKSFAGLELRPDKIILDPLLTLTAPEDVTINCALDTCSHAMESLWNKNATDSSAAYANKALEYFVKALPCLLVDLSDLKNRELMQLSSFYAGMAISITRTAIAHSISYPLTLHLGMPHGLACSFTLSKIAEYVDRENAWYQSTDILAVKNALTVLKRLGLPERISKYGSMQQITSYTGEMKTPGRAENFVLNDISVDEILTL